MTPEELTERCTQAYDQLMTFEIPVTHEASESLYLRNMAILKSLCREMMAEGALAMCDGLTGKFTEIAEECRQEAQRVKDDGA